MLKAPWQVVRYDDDEDDDDDEKNKHIYCCGVTTSKAV